VAPPGRGPGGQCARACSRGRPRRRVQRAYMVLRAVRSVLARPRGRVGPLVRWRPPRPRLGRAAGRR